MPRTLQPMVITPGLDRLLDFYTGLLDAKETTRVPDEGPVFFVGLQIGDSERGRGSAPGRHPTHPPRRGRRGAGADVDEILAKVEPLGGQVRSAANDMPWGQRVAHIQDPDGNAINLTQPI